MTSRADAEHDSDPTVPHGCARRRLAGTPASRRALVAGAVGIPFLAACGSGEQDSASDDSSGGSSDSGSGGSGESSGGSAPGGIPTSDVPVGGGTIFKDQEIVVTQPTEGDFKAFSAICTHQQCLVTEVTEEGIDCSCHGSVFSLEDGSVLDGPADEPLPSRSVQVDGDSLTVT